MASGTKVFECYCDLPRCRLHFVLRDPQHLRFPEMFAMTLERRLDQSFEAVRIMFHGISIGVSSVMAEVHPDPQKTSQRDLDLMGDHPLLPCIVRHLECAREDISKLQARVLKKKKKKKKTNPLHLLLNIFLYHEPAKTVYKDPRHYLQKIA
jgi:hypothetical protein